MEMNLETPRGPTPGPSEVLSGDTWTMSTFPDSRYPLASDEAEAHASSSGNDVAVTTLAKSPCSLLFVGYRRVCLNPLEKLYASTLSSFGRTTRDTVKFALVLFWDLCANLIS